MRLERRLAALAAIGGTQQGGVTRLALTEDEMRAHDACAQWMKEAGMEVRRDDFGNLIGRLPGAGRTDAAWVMGSHLDSVPNGGRFDGVAGVISALEAVAILREKDVRLHHDVEIVAFVGEESSRFGIATLGSLAATNQLTNELLTDVVDASGTSIADALRKLGRDPSTVIHAGWSPQRLKGFLEVHIEQRPNLDERQVPLGLVTSSAGHIRMQIEIVGEARHSGATAMDARMDALVAAAELILATQRAALNEADYATVATVSMLTIDPNAINVIPGKALVGLDLRGTDNASLARVHSSIENHLHMTEGRGFSTTCEVTSSVTPVHFDRSIIDALEASVEELGYRAVRTYSAAGHDAMNMARSAPTAMIFVPSRGGVSHHPDEFTHIKYLAIASELLSRTLLHLDRMERDDT